MAPQVDGYDDISEVARGGFGVVYRARHVQFDRIVALKVLSQLQADDSATRRWERECRAMGALSWHPNIVVVYDLGTTADGAPYLAMEFLDRGSFADRLLQEGPLPWADAVAAIVQVAGALQAAHDAGVLHRDLKPENMLVGHYGEAKLSDFGLATSDQAVATAAGMASFTLAHASPEALRGERVGVAGDVYSLGSTLHHLLGGRPPFLRDTDDSLLAAVNRVINDPVPDLRSAGVPAGVAAAVEAAMAKDPAQRPSAAGFGRMLQEAQASSGVPVTELLEDPRGGGAGPGAVAGASEVGPASEVSGETISVPTAPGLPVDPGATVAPPAAARPGEAPAVEGSGPTVTPTVVPAPDLAPVSGGAAAPEAVAAPDAARVGSPPATAHGSAGPAPAGVASGVGSTGLPPGAGQPPPGGVQQSLPSAGQPPAGEASRGRRRVLVLLASVAVLVVIVVGALALTRGGGGDDADGGGGGGAAVDDGASAAGDDGVVGTVVATIDVGATPRGVAVADGAAWVANRDDGTVSRVDTSDNTVTATTDVGEGPRDVAVGLGAVWVTSFEAQQVAKLDPADGTVLDTVDFDGGPQAVTTAADLVWVTDRADQSVEAIDPDTLDVVDEIAVGADPSAIVADGDEFLWVTNRDDGTLSKISIADRAVADTFDVGSEPGEAAVDDTDVWLASEGESSVLRIDKDSGRIVNAIDLGERVEGVALDDAGQVWADGGSQLFAIDPADDSVVGEVEVGNDLREVASGEGSLWTVPHDAAVLSRIDPS